MDCTFLNCYGKYGEWRAYSVDTPFVVNADGALLVELIVGLCEGRMCC